jgi:hypothetical protein
MTALSWSVYSANDNVIRDVVQQAASFMDFPGGMNVLSSIQRLEANSQEEIRNRIYGYLLAEESPKDVGFHIVPSSEAKESCGWASLHPGSPYAGLTQVNRLVRAEFRPLYRQIWGRITLRWHELPRYLAVFPLEDLVQTERIRAALVAVNNMELSTEPVDILPVLHFLHSNVLGFWLSHYSTSAGMPMPVLVRIFRALHAAGKGKYLQEPVKRVLFSARDEPFTTSAKLYVHVKYPHIVLEPTPYNDTREREYEKNLLNEIMRRLSYPPHGLLVEVRSGHLSMYSMYSRDGRWETTSY